MATAAIDRRHDCGEFLTLPDDGIGRWHIQGELREAGMTVRNWLDSTITAKLALALGKWWEQQPPPRGRVLCGEAGVRLAKDDILGMDLAYVSHEVMSQQSGNTTLIEGLPTLVVETLSQRKAKRNQR